MRFQLPTLALSELRLDDGAEASNEDSDSAGSPDMRRSALALTPRRVTSSTQLLPARHDSGDHPRARRRLCKDSIVRVAPLLQLPASSPPSSIASSLSAVEKHVRGGNERATIELPDVVGRCGTKKRHRRSSGSSEDEEIVNCLASAPPLGVPMCAAPGVTRPHAPTQLMWEACGHVKPLSSSRDPLSCSAPSMLRASAKKRSCPESVDVARNNDLPVAATPLPVNNFFACESLKDHRPLLRVVQPRFSVSHACAYRSRHAYCKLVVAG